MYRADTSTLGQLVLSRFKVSTRIEMVTWRYGVLLSTTAQCCLIQRLITGLNGVLVSRCSVLTLSWGFPGLSAQLESGSARPAVT